MADQSYREVTEFGSGTLHVWDLPTDVDTLLAVVTKLFETYWQSLNFGVLVQGAAWEVKAPNAPTRISMFDGYVTVDFGSWHFHLCIGEHTASGPELGRIRRTSDARLYRRIGDHGAPVSWAVQYFNGEGTQQMTTLAAQPLPVRRPTTAGGGRLQPPRSLGRPAQHIPRPGAGSLRPIRAVIYALTRQFPCQANGPSHQLRSRPVANPSSLYSRLCWFGHLPGWPSQEGTRCKSGTAPQR